MSSVFGYKFLIDVHLPANDEHACTQLDAESTLSDAGFLSVLSSFINFNYILNIFYFVIKINVYFINC